MAGTGSHDPNRRRERCEKLVKIGARIVRHGRYVVFQLAEVAVPRALFAEILRRIDRLRPEPPRHELGCDDEWIPTA